MIINPMICEYCHRELQFEDIGVNVNLEGEIIKVCGFCRNIIFMESD